MYEDEEMVNCEKEKKIIVIPFAFDDNKKTGANINSQKAKDFYFMNSCVACVSAKFSNTDCEVAFVTNYPSESIPEEYRELLKRNSIRIMTIPYDRFLFPDDYTWSLAFYKLCALSHIIELEYDYICYLDCDVWVQHTFDYIWEECRDNILLYDINHGLQVKDYQSINTEFIAFNPEYRHVTHYGGEFFAASRDKAILFCDNCMEIYREMIRTSFITKRGDEFIISLAANNMKQSIKNAGAYIYRFWTDAEFHLVSTCYQYNPVCVLHMPVEKNKGIIKLFNQFIRNGRIPSNERVWKICHLTCTRKAIIVHGLIRSIMKHIF